MSKVLRAPVILPVLFGLMLLGALRMPKRVSGNDLTAFGNLPVLHNGRIKPLDSIARNALLVIRGKQTLQVDGGRMSAVQWFLELSADPGKGDGFKIFVINDPDVLGLIGIRQTKEKYYSFKDLSVHGEKIGMQAAQAEQVDAKQRTRFQGAIIHLNDRLNLYQRVKYSLRISDDEDMSAAIANYEKAIVEGLEAFKHHQTPGAKGFDNEALSRLGVFFQQFNFIARAAYFKPLPPPPGHPAEAWRNMGEGLLEAMRDGVVPPASRSYVDILDAYKRGDAASFNGLTAQYAEGVAARMPESSRRARYEMRFNRFEPFYQGMILYVVAFLLVCLSWVYRPESMRTTAFRLIVLAFVVHSLGLVARMWLQGRPPVTNLYSSAVFVGWGGVLLGIVLERMHRSGLASLAAGVVGFCTLILAHHLSMSGDTLEMMAAVLDSNFWLGTHVVTITIGYSSTFIAGMLAHVYIFRALAGRLDKATAKSLTQMTYGIVCFSLLLCFVGTILGGIWADQSWGRFWGWDPKENGALLLVLWQGVILHARLGGHIRERGLAATAVGGNIICALAWFGVNMLGIGLHTYGFMDKAFYWLMAFCASQLIVIGLAFVPPSFFSWSKWAGGKGSIRTA